MPHGRLYSASIRFQALAQADTPPMVPMDVRGGGMYYSLTSHHNIRLWHAAPIYRGRTHVLNSTYTMTKPASWPSMDVHVRTVHSGSRAVMELHPSTSPCRN